MTNEQREAIELAKEFTKMDFSNPIGWTGYYDAELKELSQAIDIVLSLIKEQQIYIKKSHDTTEEMNRDITILIDEMKQKDKQIDLYVDELICNEFDRCCQECCRECEKDKDTLRHCIKQYFERKVKDEK